MYRSDGDTYEQVCRTLEINAGMKAIEVLVRQGHIHVRGTLLKPDEARHIAWGCQRSGYTYHGPFA